MEPKKRGRKPRCINLVGIELEGGWNERPNGPGSWHSDGSVSEISLRHAGEFVSPPMVPSKVFLWIKEHYPQETNHSCGLHVHVSMRHALHYALLMERDYHVFLRDKLFSWGKRAGIRESSAYWRRLEHGNGYCQRIPSDPEEAQALFLDQARSRCKGSERYFALNYCHALHGTVEHRMLPAFKSAKYAAHTVRFLLRQCERYLRALPIGPIPLPEETVDIPEDIVPEKTETVTIEKEG